MKNVCLLAAAAAALAAPAFADDIVLSAPSKGLSLHDGPADMTAYYEPAAEAGLLEVVATYAPRDGAREPGRLILRMRDGDAVSFTLPGIENVTYSFARAGEEITVRGDARVRTASVD